MAGLEASRLKPAPVAPREQLIRRVTFGLIGLPPTPDEITAFVNDRSPRAYEQLIDRLLSSPHYGERWARHWLDLVRYAESDGFEHDALRPHSWRYRDYVVKSYNEDKPYDRFVREQIAGDELWPDQPDALIATAFNLLGPDMVDSADQVQRRLNTLNDATDTTASVFLGLTLGCARCHNHKFEPITQRDYFSMQAFFASAQFQRELPVPSSLERTEHDRLLARYRLQSAAKQKELDALEAPYRERLTTEKLSLFSEDAQLAHRTPKEKRTMEQEGTVAETAPMLKFTDAELAKEISGIDAARRTQLLSELKGIPKPPALPTTMALQNSDSTPPKAFVLVRGDYNNPGDEVDAGFPSVLSGANWTMAHAASGTVKPRAALAEWIASPANPLTARVMVNRIWQHHFGRGLVGTPSDFGTRGERPSHPELLDWLADGFIARGWSVKAMHKLILMSAVYQQSSVPSTDGMARDPDNKLLSHQNRVRLDGEAVRDSLLAVSGRLNRRMGGPSVSPPISREITKVSKNWTASPDSSDHVRRSLYILARRNLRFPFLEVFDAPDSNLSCPERGRSTTAPQSLTLLNSDELMDAARAVAKRLYMEDGNTDERVALVFRSTTGRDPTRTERRMARDFLSATGSRRKAADSIDAERQSTKLEATVADWSELCRALFNLNAFIYVD